MRKRIISLRFRSPSEAAEFLLLVSSFAKNTVVEQSGSSVKLIIPESSPSAREEYAKLLALVRQWKLSRQNPRGGLYRHSITMVLSSAELKVGIPVSAVVELLQLKGFRASVEGGFIQTNATFEQVVSVAREFSEKYAEALHLPAVPLARRLVALIATALHCPIDKALEEAKRAGLVKEDDERGLVLTCNYSAALERLRPLLSGGSS